jgi:hypothetical protein
MPKNPLWMALVVLFAGCDERDRLTFPNSEPGDDQGPITLIDIPSEDTVLTEGEAFALSGRSIDANGVDTVYFQIEGGGVDFSPFVGEGADTVRFGLLIPTIGHAGQTITVTARAVDLLSNQGGPTIRRLSIE